MGIKALTYFGGGSKFKASSNARFIPLERILGIIFLFGGLQVFSQFPELADLENRLDHSEPNTRERFELTMELGQAFQAFPVPPEIMQRDYPDKYLTYAKEAYQWASAAGTFNDLGRAQRFLIDSYTLSDSNQPIDFIEIAEEMISLNSFASYEDKHAVYDRLVGRYMRLGIIDRFIELTDSLNHIKRKLNLPEGTTADEYGQIAMAYYKLKDYKNAREYWRKQCEELVSLDQFMLASSVNNIGLSFAKQFEKDSARNYYSKALELLEGKFERDQKEVEHLKNVITTNLIWQDVEDRRYDRIVPRIENELSTGLEQDDIITAIQACNKLGYIFYLKKQYKLANDYIDRASKLVSPKSDFYLMMESWNVRSKILLAQGKVEESEELSRKRIALEDSINYARNALSGMVTAVIYQTNKKELALQQQELLLSKQEAEITKSNQLQVIYIIGLLFLVALLIFAYYFIRHTKRQKAKIEKQKAVIDKALAEKEILLKEVHHRVKNNLQVVSSLLGKQGRDSDSEIVKKYMEEGQSRIQSIAMIHQQLYQDENFKDINLEEYTNLLLKNIAQYHKQKSDNVHLIVEVPKVLFHVDVAVPYGLILNELINNCYEHAFEGSSGHKINVAVEAHTDGYFKLTVADNGKGFQSDIEERTKSSLGINLVKGLAWQLRGEVNYHNTSEGGTFEVTFVNSLAEVA